MNPGRRAFLAAAPGAALSLPGTRRDSAVWLWGLRYAPEYPQYVLVAVTPDQQDTKVYGPHARFHQYWLLSKRVDMEVVKVPVLVRPWWVEVSGERGKWDPSAGPEWGGRPKGPDDENAQAADWDQALGASIRQAKAALDSHMDVWRGGRK